MQYTPDEAEGDGPASELYDSIATVVWKCLKLAGVDARRVTEWGSLFQQA